MTTDADRRLLLQLAREAITAHVNPQSPSQSAISNLQSAILSRPSGAFVTLHARGDLRGCIGHIEPTDPLGVVVPRCAVAACSTDPRFPPVASHELTDISIEISLLGLLEPIAGSSDIVIGRHGLVVERGWQRGLLLPQVAVEWQWSAEEFFVHTCRKAGLPDHATAHGLKVWRFEAEVFGEPPLRGLDTKPTLRGPDTRDTKDTKNET